MTQQKSDENLTPPVNTSNEFLIAYNGSLGVVPMMRIRAVTRQQAYRAAAWLVAIGEMLPDEDTREQLSGGPRGRQKHMTSSS